MRKIIVLATIFVIAAVVVVWSKSHGVRVQATEASITIAPSEFMKNPKDLPREQWDAF